MTFNTYVQAKVTVAGFHSWPQAPHPVQHLSWPHRHLFVIRATLPVDHANREVEFQLLGQDVLIHLSNTWQHYPGFPDAFNFGAHSCEYIATELMQWMPFQMVSVHEDDENGAVVVRPG